MKTIIRPYLSKIINDHSYSFIHGIILVLFLLKILMRPLTCIQRVIGSEKYQEGLEESKREVS